VVRPCVCSRNFMNENALAQWGALTPKERKNGGGGVLSSSLATTQFLGSLCSTELVVYRAVVTSLN
jgi:hypothetical protein